MENRLVLGVDNSIDFLNIAISIEEKLIEERNIRGKRAPSETLPVEVSHILSDHGYTIDNMSLIIVTLGPGSFTGIRVGLAFCKGLSIGKGIPLIGVPTLDVLALPLSFMEGHYLCPMIDAKKGEVFLSLYHISGGNIERLIDYQAVKPKDLGSVVKTPCVCFGTGVALCEEPLSSIDGVDMIKDAFYRISGETLIKEGLKRAAQTGQHDLNPIYGRRSEAEIKLGVKIV
jgi:tRNA threonylcarbamoyladenosine biosynthesis protein TsaB